MSADYLINWVLQTGLDISILIALILIFRRPFGRMFGAVAAYSLWLLPLIRLFLPEMPITIPRPLWMSTPRTIAPEVFEFSAAVPVVSAPMTEPVNWQLPVLTLWLGVALLWLCSQLINQRRYLRDVLQNSAPASDRVQSKLADASHILRLRRHPRVRLASKNVGPLVTGIVNPVIILPDNFETEFSDRQQFFALTHELAHIKRFDLFAAFMTLVFRALNWPNPLVHFGAAKFRADQEAACDAYVLKTVGGGTPTKQTYAETLIHSARLSRSAPASMDAASTNPLCLTIHHPLKERLMTMKTSKTNSTILSRIGVAAFLAAGLVITAPINIASAQDAPNDQTLVKRVIKSVNHENGVETTKTLEIIEENGVKTIYSIDEHGNKTIVQEDELGNFPMLGDDIEVMVMEDGEPGAKSIKIMGDEFHHSGDGQHSKVIVKRMSKGEDGQALAVDSNVFVMKGHGGEGMHAVAMVGAAKQLLDQAETMQGGKELSSKAKRKIEKARKALAEAEAALVEE